MMHTCTHNIDGKCSLDLHPRPSLSVCMNCSSRNMVTLMVRSMPVHEPQQEPRAAPVEPVAAASSSEWPAWAKWVGTLRADGEQGVGSTFEACLGRAGLAFKAAWAVSFGSIGIPCGCSGRKERWDRLYPYADSGGVDNAISTGQPRPSRL